MKTLRASTFIFATVAASFASANSVKNPSFESVETGSLLYWTAEATYDGAPASSIHVTNKHQELGRWSCWFADGFAGNADFQQSVTQIFDAPLGKVTEAYFYGLSFEQNIYAKLLYTDGSFTKVDKKFTSGSPDNWMKFDLLSSVDGSKDLKGITIGVDMGSFDLRNEAFIDHVVINGQPVPEPTTILALAGGIGMILRRRKNRI